MIRWPVASGSEGASEGGVSPRERRPVEIRMTIGQAPLEHVGGSVALQEPRKPRNLARDLPMRADYSRKQRVLYLRDSDCSAEDDPAIKDGRMARILVPARKYD